MTPREAIDNWRRGDAASEAVASEFERTSFGPGWTSYGAARLAVGALLRAGWVLVPPASTAESTRPPNWLAEIIERREQARAVRDFAKADTLRGEALQRGYLLEDTPKGTEWRRA